MIRTILVAAALSLVAAVALAADTVNINKASAEELVALDNVGEARAQAIVEYREEQGPFPSISALANVSGIGSATLERNRERLTVSAE